MTNFRNRSIKDARLAGGSRPPPRRASSSVAHRVGQPITRVRHMYGGQAATQRRRLAAATAKTQAQALGFVPAAR